MLLTPVMPIHVPSIPLFTYQSSMLLSLPMTPAQPKARPNRAVQKLPDDGPRKHPLGAKGCFSHHNNDAKVRLSLQPRSIGCGLKIISSKSKINQPATLLEVENHGKSATFHLRVPNGTIPLDSHK